MGVLSSVIGRNIRKFRQQRQLSQSGLAELSGLSKQTIVDLEAERANPTMATIEVMASALEVSPRALLTELGSEVLFQSDEPARWEDQGALLVRNLDQVYGSGYVFNAVIRLDAARGTARSRHGTRGMLRHCYVLEGLVELGPEGQMVRARAGDFVRFPGEGPHSFVALTPSALVFVNTTMPQLSLVAGARF